MSHLKEGEKEAVRRIEQNGESTMSLYARSHNCPTCTCMNPVPEAFNPADQQARITELEAENKALRHDIAGYVEANTDLLNQNIVLGDLWKWTTRRETESMFTDWPPEHRETIEKLTGDSDEEN